MNANMDAFDALRIAKNTTEVTLARLVNNYHQDLSVADWHALPHTAAERKSLSDTLKGDLYITNDGAHVTHARLARTGAGLIGSLGEGSESKTRLPP